MSSEISIAIIMAIASLLVAIVSLVNSIVSNRQNSKQLKAIESLKFELANKQTAQKISDDYLLKDLESLDVMIQTIQRMKDMMQLILNTSGTSLDSASTIDSISKIRQDLFGCYEERLPNLKDLDVKSAHRAKNQALAIESRIRDYLKGTTYVSEISNEQKQIVLELRNNLTDSQNQLRDSRMKKLIQRMEMK